MNNNKIYHMYLFIVNSGNYLLILFLENNYTKFNLYRVVLYYCFLFLI